MAQQQTNNLDDLMRRPYRYFYVDGLVEMGVGGLFFIIGLFLLVMTAAQQATALAWVAGIALVVLIIGGTYGVKWLIGVLKERVTYQRTGYVSYRQQPDRGRWLVVAGALLLAVLMLALPDWGRRMAFVDGTLLAIILGYLGYRASLRRLYVIGGVAFLIGLGASLFTANEILGTTLTFAGTGLALLISGGFALGTYLRDNPPADEAQQ